MGRDERAAPRLQLLEARCNQKLGRWGNAQRAAARVVEAMASYSTWTRGQPRMLAVALGASSALELGDGVKALGFLSSVLRYDPDQHEIRAQHKQLKQVPLPCRAQTAQVVACAPIWGCELLPRTIRRVTACKHPLLAGAQTSRRIRDPADQGVQP